MRTSYEERAKKFIALLNPYIKGCRAVYQFENAIDRFNTDYHRNVVVAFGSTRIAFITSDYVIKINYHGWGEGTFGGCADEVKMYRYAQKQGYAHLLAKITPYRGGYNRTFYIMPKISNIRDGANDAEYYLSDEEEEKWLCKNIGDRHCLNYGWKDGHIVMIDYAYNIFTGY